MLLGAVLTGSLSKPDPGELPFIGKTEQLFLVVFGHYNIMLRAKLANIVDNAMNSRGQTSLQTYFDCFQKWRLAMKSEIL